MAKNAFGDEVVETKAVGAQTPTVAAGSPTFRQRFATAMAPDEDSQLATARGFFPSARMATPAEEHPPIVNQYVPDQNPKSMHGILYKDAGGNWQPFFPADDYSKLAAGAVRDTAIAGTSMAGAGVGLASPIPGGTLLGAGAGAMAGDSLANMIGSAMGAQDTRTVAKSLWDKVWSGVLGAGSEATGQVGGKVLKQVGGALATNGKVLRPDAEGILQRMEDANIQPSRGAIFTDPQEVAQKAVAKKTGEVQNIIESIPTTKKTPEDVGMALRESAKSKSGFDPITKTVEAAGPYFEGANRAYDAGLSQVRGKGANVDLTNSMQSLQSGLSAWKETPNIGKKVMGNDAEVYFKDLVKANGEMPFDNLKRWHTELGKEINATQVRGEAIPDHVIELFKAQQKDLETYAKANGTGKALEAANAIWKTSSQEAGYVAPLVRAKSGTAALKVSAEDLSPEAISLIQKINSPDTFNGFRQQILTKLGTVVGDRSTPTRFDLGELFDQVKKLDPRTVDLFMPPTLPAAAGRAAGAVPNPDRQVLDAAMKSAEETGFFGMDAINKTSMNPIIKTLRDVKSATAKWLYADKIADMPGMLKWFASASSIRSDNTSRLLAFIGNIPNATVRDELVKATLKRTQPVDVKAKGE